MIIGVAAMVTDDVSSHPAPLVVPQLKETDPATTSGDHRPATPAVGEAEASLPSNPYEPPISPSALVVDDCLNVSLIRGRPVPC